MWAPAAKNACPDCSEPILCYTASRAGHAKGIHTPSMTHQTTLIYNPTAGPWDMTRPLKRLASYLARSGWQIEIVQTEQPGDALAHAREAAQRGADCVLLAGGDGTINEAVNGLYGTPTMLGMVPVGTGNVLAHQLRMPLLTAVTIKEVGDTLLKSRIQRVDVGITNDRRFISWGGWDWTPRSRPSWSRARVRSSAFVHCPTSSPGSPSPPSTAACGPASLSGIVPSAPARCLP